MATKDRKLRLKSKDKEIFEVEEAVAFQSKTIETLVEDVGCDAIIPLFNVDAKTLAGVIEYCTYHVRASKENSSVSDDDVNIWDKQFICVDEETLFNLILAADYLNIKSLFELACQAAADIIMKTKSVKRLRKMFSIQNDFTHEELKAIKSEIQWPFE